VAESFFAAAIGRALGYPDSENGLPSTLPDAVMENARKLHIVPESFHKPSMLLDAEKGQPIEVEVIFGEVVRMAQERGVEMPVSGEYLPFDFVIYCAISEWKCFTPSCSSFRTRFWRSWKPRSSSRSSLRYSLNTASISLPQWDHGSLLDHQIYANPILDLPELSDTDRLLAGLLERCE